MMKNDVMGFLGLISEDHKLAPMLTEDIQAGQLGFAVLNDYFSEKLFPSISTLMPNLVYCYMIFALTYKEEKKTDEEWNDILVRITSASTGSGRTLAGSGRGFHGEVQENVVGTYRNFMRRYGFYDASGDSEFGKLNQALADSNRYKAIRNGINNNFSGKALDEKLTQNEREDMAKRCKILVAQGSGALFDYIVCKKINEKGNSTLPIFENIQELFKGIEELLKEKKEQEDWKEIQNLYRAARFTSIMEYYVKCRSNQLLREEKCLMQGNQQNGQKDNTNQEIINSIGDINTEDMLNIIENELCKEKLRKLINIYKALKGQEKKADELIRELMKNVDGTNKTIWNQKEITEYIDTFRWEYRPENMNREAGEKTKCASFFVKELLGG